MRKGRQRPRRYGIGGRRRRHRVSGAGVKEERIAARQEVGVATSWRMVLMNLGTGTRGAD